MKAICIRCGAVKRAPYKRCSQCGFDPSLDDAALVKSVYLSTGRFVTREETEEEEQRQVQYSKELDDVAARLKAGREIEYDENELVRLKRELELMRSIPGGAVWVALLRLFLPALLLLSGLWLLNLMLRALLRK